MPGELAYNNTRGTIAHNTMKYATYASMQVFYLSYTRILSRRDTMKGKWRERGIVANATPRRVNVRTANGALKHTTCSRYVRINQTHVEKFRSFNYRNIIVYGTYGPTLAALVFFLYLCRLRANHETTTVATPTDTDNEHDEEENESIVSKSFYLRLTIFYVTIVLISLCAVVSLVSTYFCMITYYLNTVLLGDSESTNFILKKLRYKIYIFTDFSKKWNIFFVGIRKSF